MDVDTGNSTFATVVPAKHDVDRSCTGLVYRYTRGARPTSKADRNKDRRAWTEEGRDVGPDSCERQGLPRPKFIDIDKNSWHRGVPRAIPGQSGFPLMPVKSGRSSRQQVHVWLQFEQPIEGPLILGAGRYRGYGFLKPVSDKRTK